MRTARLVDVDPQAYLLRAVYAAIARPGAVTFPDDLKPATATYNKKRLFQQAQPAKRAGNNASVKLRL